MANQIPLPAVHLTPVDAASEDGIDVAVSELIAYSQQRTFTRLRLIGRKTLDVKETTDRIDRLIRRASSAAGLNILNVGQIPVAAA
jgi:hypothetical protein